MCLFPPALCDGFYSSIYLPRLIICNLVNRSHLVRWAMVSLAMFTCIFLLTNDLETLQMLLYHLCICFCEISILSFGNYCISIIWFFLASLKKFCLLLDIKKFSNIWFENILSLLAYLLISLMVSLGEKYFNFFMKYNLYYRLCLYVISRKLKATVITSYIF